MIYDYRKEYYRKGSWQNIFLVCKNCIDTSYQVYSTRHFSSKTIQNLKKNGPRIILVRNSFISGRNSSSKIKRTFFSITQIYYRVYNEKITISFSREFSSGELNYLSITISCRLQEKELKCDSELNSKYIDLHLVHLLFCNRILSYPSKDDGCVFFFYQILSRLKPWKKK